MTTGNSKPRKRQRRKRSGQSAVEMIPQPHGGALQRGNPGNKGGGRTPNVVRQMFRDSYGRRLPVLEDIADGKPIHRVQRVGGSGGPVEIEISATPGDRISAMRELRAGGFGDAGHGLMAAQLETPEGYTFSLVIGERELDDGP